MSRVLGGAGLSLFCGHAPQVTIKSWQKGGVDFRYVSRLRSGQSLLRSATQLLSEGIFPAVADVRAIQTILQQQGVLASRLTSANPLPDQINFSEASGGCGHGARPLHDLEFKWPKLSTINGLGDRILAQFCGGASLLEASSGRVYSLSLGPQWQVRWCSWCSDYGHVAILYIRVSSQKCIQQRLCILDSKQPAGAYPGKAQATRFHIAASHAFTQARDRQNHRPLSWKAGWPVACVAQHADLVIFPNDGNTVLIHSLPGLVKGSQLTCQPEVGQSHEPQEAAWTCQGQAVVQWLAPAPNRAYITIHMPHDGAVCYSLSMPLAGHDWYISECLVAPCQPYLAVHICCQGTHQMQLVDVVASSTVCPSTRTCTDAFSMRWSPSGKYLIVKEHQRRNRRGHLKIYSALSGTLVYHNGKSLLSCDDILWSSIADADICLLAPGTQFDPDMLMLKGVQPAEYHWLERNRVEKIQLERNWILPDSLQVCARMSWSFGPHEPLLVGYVDVDTMQQNGSIGIADCWHLGVKTGKSSRMRVTDQRRKPLRISSMAWQPSLKMCNIFAAVSTDDELYLVDAMRCKVLSTVSLLTPSMDYAHRQSSETPARKFDLLHISFQPPLYTRAATQRSEKADRPRQRRDIAEEASQAS
ncbi:hypothetical protein WJX74_008880 [Apatococcus lobatus]|uniref:Uncharacterized protein n=1 Tax=Apatococcus lobatus TaxID=904363 RepID=A0AAW1QD66_9CHLO